ncbi:MAG: hypothetical protein AAF297_08490 [Planctomycetota bacterium]
MSEKKPETTEDGSGSGAGSAAGSGAVKAGAASKKPTLSSTPKPPTLSSTPKPPKLIGDPRGRGRGGPAGGYRPEKKVPVKPKRVRGGVKLKAGEDESIGNWVSQRLMRVVESAASGEALREGLEYARLGQIKRLDITEDGVEASVQGRMTRPYEVKLRLTRFDNAAVERVVGAMGEQAKYAAKLLSGELPRDIEDLFAPLGLRLLPTEASEFGLECNCREENKPWCKHAVCVAAVLAERLADEPLVVFGLRGLPMSEIVERLRENRALAGHGSGPAAVYVPRVPGASDVPAEALDGVLERFWDDPSGRAPVLPRVSPEVDKPLLRRLGASPFEAKFPLVGLLATCYELVAEQTVRDEDAESGGGDADEGDAGAGDGED